jgi:hypothetical protein
MTSLRVESMGRVWVLETDMDSMDVIDIVRSKMFSREEMDAPDPRFAVALKITKEKQNEPRRK